MNKYLSLAVAGLAFFSASALAGVREDVLTAMQRCSVISDDRAWLDCTYGAQQLMRAKLGLTPAPEFQQRLVPPASAAPAQMQALSASAAGTQNRPLPRRRGGIMQLFSGSNSPIAVSALDAVRYDRRGAFIATLQNGQVWHQVNVLPGDARVRLTLGSKITITAGSLGSYDLKTEGNPHAYKVDLES